MICVKYQDGGKIPQRPPRIKVIHAPRKFGKNNLQAPLFAKKTFVNLVIRLYLPLPFCDDIELSKDTVMKKSIEKQEYPNA